MYPLSGMSICCGKGADSLIELLFPSVYPTGLGFCIASECFRGFVVVCFGLFLSSFILILTDQNPDTALKGLQQPGASFGSSSVCVSSQSHAKLCVPPTQLLALHLSSRRVATL